MSISLLDRFLNGDEQVLWWVPPEGWRLECPVEIAGLLPGSFNPLHRGHLNLCQTAESQLGGLVTGEVSIRNADKPRLTVAEVEHRCRQFTSQPVSVTAAATFAEKCRLFPGVTFVVGADTAARVVDPRFYQGDTQLMHDALEEIRNQGCTFLVAARYCDQQLLTLDQLPIPRVFQRLFREIPVEEFRVDLSSTDLRGVF